MAHSSEKRWRMGMNPEAPNAEGVATQASAVCDLMMQAFTQGEAAFAEMQELYTYAGGTIQLLADLLFKEDIEARAESVANAAEVAKVQDAFDAITALHELYQCADNQIVAQEDRLAQLRRMT